MKITKNKLRQLVNESYSSEAAYQAGYEDARRGRRHGDNPQMRNLDPRQYDYGFDRGTADNASDRRRPDEYDRRISDGKIMITKEQLQKIISEEKQKLLNENVPSALGMEILSIKDALFDILMGVRTLAADAGHGEDLAEDLEMQIERLREIGYKKA
jgi:hypothetical protein